MKKQNKQNHQSKQFLEKISKIDIFLPRLIWEKHTKKTYITKWGHYERYKQKRKPLKKKYKFPKYRKVL